jgi:hypothetical protein
MRKTKLTKHEVMALLAAGALGFPFDPTQKKHSTREVLCFVYGADAATVDAQLAVDPPPIPDDVPPHAKEFLEQKRAIIIAAQRILRKRLAANTVE